MNYFTAAWIGACIGCTSCIFYMSLVIKESSDQYIDACNQRADKIKYEASGYLSKYEECSTRFSKCEMGEK